MPARTAGDYFGCVLAQDVETAAADAPSAQATLRTATPPRRAVAVQRTWVPLQAEARWGGVTGSPNHGQPPALPEITFQLDGQPVFREDQSAKIWIVPVRRRYM